MFIIFASIAIYPHLSGYLSSRQWLYIHIIGNLSPRHWLSIFTSVVIYVNLKVYLSSRQLLSIFTSLVIFMFIDKYPRVNGYLSPHHWLSSSCLLINIFTSMATYLQLNIIYLNVHCYLP